MKKSILFASLALIVYLLSTILIGMSAKQLKLIDNQVQNRVPVKDSFHYLKIKKDMKNYCSINITEGTSQYLSFGKSFENRTKPDFFVRNDTLNLNILNSEFDSYSVIDVNTDTLRGITISSNNNMNVEIQMGGNVKNVLLYGNMDISFRSCHIDTLNIQSGTYGRISIDTSQIKMLNLYHNKNSLINFNINRSPLPEIRHYDETIVPK